MGRAAGQVVVLGWLRRRRARDGMEIHLRWAHNDGPDNPPRLLLVPREG